MGVGIRLAIAGGGTGGHVYPMLAVARAVERQAPGSELLFVGTRRGIEARLVPEAGYRLATLRIGGLKGKSALRRLATMGQLPWAVLASAVLLARFRPQAVLGGGGFASGPVGLAASLLRTPLALLEVNSLPGFTNRRLAGRARVAYVAFRETAARMRCPVVVTGNPVRDEVRGEPPRAAEGPLRLLVLGGSQGAVGLNSLVVAALPHLEALGVPLAVTHQAGALDLERVRGAYREAGLAARVEPFLTDIASAYREAELAVSRAGATTVAELIAARRPAIFVPLPTAADNHQEHNALAVVAAGGGELLRQPEADGALLAERIACWYDRREGLEQAGAALAVLDHPDAAERIAGGLIALAGGRG